MMMSELTLSQNDFAALVEDNVLPPDEAESSLFKSETARGKCYVICFSPRHDLTVAEMSDAEIGGVVAAWCVSYKRATSFQPTIASMAGPSFTSMCLLTTLGCATFKCTRASLRIQAVLGSLLPFQL